MVTLTVTNAKGGVCKTTTVVNLSTRFANLGYKVLAIDMDPQCNSTDTLLGRVIPDYKDEVTGLRPSQTIARIFGDTPEVIPYQTSTENLWCVPSHIDLSGADSLIKDTTGIEIRLKVALENLKQQFDIVLIDTPRDMNIVVKNALVVSDSLIIPTSPDMYAVQGIDKVLTTAKNIRKYHNPSLKMLGVLLTKTENTELSKKTYLSLDKTFGDRLFRTKIAKNVAAAEAPGHNMSIFEHNPGSTAAGNYAALANEILTKLGIDR